MESSPLVLTDPNRWPNSFANPQFKTFFEKRSPRLRISLHCCSATAR